MSNIQKSNKDLKGFLDNPQVKDRIRDVLGKNSGTFATSIVQIANQSKMLAEAEPSSVVGSALTAATLKLPLNNSIGQAYIVPFREKQKDGSYITKAQFMLGYKGLKQLAIRSGQYLALYAKKVYEGQKVDDESFLGYHFEWGNKKSDKVIGYASYFKLVNGFESLYFMDENDMKKHAKKFSQTYKNGFGVWKDDFEKMALKTVTKLHLNGGEAPLSIELTNAIEKDQSVVSYNEEENTEDISYVDNEEEEIDPDLKRQRELVENIQSIEDLEFCEGVVTDETLLPVLEAHRKKFEKQAKN
jgi:recombination protein RecT